MASFNSNTYHHGDHEFKYMEQLKYAYLKWLLSRRDLETLDRCVEAVADMEKRARECYADPIVLDEIKFITLLVLDGIFLVEFFRYYNCILIPEDDPIFKEQTLRDLLHCDILLLENQLPLFVLHELFNLTEINDGVVSDENGFIDLALGFVRPNVQYRLSVSPVWHNDNAAYHLLGLIHDSLSLSFIKDISLKPQDNYGIGTKFINSVSELNEAGIKFELGHGRYLMDISYVKGVLIIPQLIVNDKVESQLSNLIVHEKYIEKGKPRYVSDYSFFMSCLVKKSKDVELLSSHGIILKCFGSDEEICQMFSRLGRNTLISYDFTYSKVFRNLNKHCGYRRNRWKANLLRNYFYSPWSIISFVAAAVLLILTIGQTLYTILGYYYRH